MNSLKGKITSLKTNGSLSLVTILVEDVFFNTIVIETPDTASYLKTGNSIKVIFKETEVVIGKGISHTISIQNKVIGEILELKKGELLSKLIINTTVGQLIAVITTDSLYQLQLEVGEKITAMIKTTEIMLSE
jgi:molybdopterin-binding protein